MRHNCWKTGQHAGGIFYWFGLAEFVRTKQASANCVGHRNSKLDIHPQALKHSYQSPQLPGCQPFPPTQCGCESKNKPPAAPVVVLHVASDPSVDGGTVPPTPMDRCHGPFRPRGQVKLRSTSQRSGLVQVKSGICAGGSFNLQCDRSGVLLRRIEGVGLVPCNTMYLLVVHLGVSEYPLY